MRRSLIFLTIFPAVATVTFYAITYILTGAVVDSGTGPAFMYLVFIVPGLMVALLDGIVAKSAMPAVLATTLLSYGLSVLVLAALLGGSIQLPVLGIIVAIPAAVCSWLTDRQNTAAQNAATQ